MQTLPKKKAHTGPSPAKKARTAGAGEEADVHPTLVWMTEHLNVLDGDLELLKTAGPVPFGGICAFSPEGYKSSMKEHHEYECNVTLCQHAIMRLEHKDLWPAIGAIKRLMDAVFTSADGDPMAVFPDTISVRAVSDIDAPEQCERLHRSAYMFAWLASWAAAKKAGKANLSATFFACARRIRTKFLFLPSEDAANRYKWSLAEETDSMADNGANLVGYKKTIGVVGVQQDLQNRGLSHDAPAIADWFKTVRWHNEADAMGTKEVHRHLRVHGRFAANQLTRVRLDLAESRFGRRHALAYLMSLDTLCTKTNVKDKPDLSSALLHWVVEGVVVLMLRGCVKSDISRDTLISKIVPKLLLIRKVSLFLFHQFKYVAQPDVIYLEGHRPEQIGKTLFGSWVGFHRAYPCGMSMDQQGTDDKTPSFVQAAPFLTKLAPSHASMLQFVASLFACLGDIDHIMAHAIAMEPNVSAESFFERRSDLSSSGLFDLKEMTETHARDTKTKTPEPEPLQPVVDVDMQAVAPEVATAEQEVAPEGGGVPEEPDAEMPEPAPTKNSVVHFPLLSFSEAAVARFESVEAKRFAAIVLHAEQRIKPYIDIKIIPSDPAAIQEYINGAFAVQQMDGKEKMMHVFCAGTGAESVHHTRATRPHKYTPPLDKTALDNAIAQVTGAADKETYATSLFAKHPSVFVISDGRRPSSSKTIASSVAKAKKAAAGGILEPVSFRLMHSNAEFAHARNLRQRGKLRVGRHRATVPEPLETLTIVMGSDFAVKPAARKYLDLPGTNRTRGLNNVPLRTSEFGVTWGTRCKILAGSSKNPPVDEGVPDWMDVDDEGNENEGVEEGTADDDQHKTGEGEEDVVEDKHCDLFPWEHHELVCREMINCFPVKTVVHHNANVSWPLACARHCINFVGFAKNDMHAEHIHKTLVATIVAEIIEGTVDGFECRRFLSRQRSIGGSTQDGGGRGLDGGTSAGGSVAAGGSVTPGGSVGSAGAGGATAHSGINEEDVSSSSPDEEE